MAPQKLLLISRLAFYPMHWEAFAHLCEHYDVCGSVIADLPPKLPSVHQQLGWMDAERAAKAPFAPDIHVAPQASKRRRRAWLKKTLAAVQPDVIWIQEEPNSPLTLSVLAAYQQDTKARLYCAVCENIFAQPRFWKRWRTIRRWRRLNGLLAVAEVAIDGIRRAGMPGEVPAFTLVGGGQAPPGPVTPAQLPFAPESDSCIVGFVGRICAEKGWHVLINAIYRLPPNFKLVMIGEGPQLQELQTVLSNPKLEGRVCYLPSQPKQDLWQYYAAMDFLVLPSLTFPQWKEQFGGVLVDAMAMGIPIIGSDSGAIPEVVGPAGRIVPEGDVEALAYALRELQANRTEAKRLGEYGRRRFREEFCISVYARKIGTILKLQERVTAAAKAA